MRIILVVVLLLSFSTGEIPVGPGPTSLNVNAGGASPGFSTGRGAPPSLQNPASDRVEVKTVDLDPAPGDIPPSTGGAPPNLPVPTSQNKKTLPSIQQSSSSGAPPSLPRKSSGASPGLEPQSEPTLVFTLLLGTWGWSSWTYCSGECPDPGTRSRTQLCSDPNGCSGSRSTETETCELDCQTVEVAVCQNLDNGLADEDGHGCEKYDEHPSYCCKYDGESGFNSALMCCGCGGGSTPEGIYEYIGCSTTPQVMYVPSPEKLKIHEDEPIKVACEKACRETYEENHVVDYISVSSTGECTCGKSDITISLGSLRNDCSQLSGSYFNAFRKLQIKYYVAYEGAYMENESKTRNPCIDYQPEDATKTYAAYCCGVNICKRALKDNCGKTTWLMAEHNCKAMEGDLELCTQADLESIDKCGPEMNPTTGGCKDHLHAPIWTSTTTTSTKYRRLHGADVEFSIGNSFTYEKDSYIFSKMFIGVVILGCLYTVYRHNTKKIEDSYLLAGEEI